MIDQIQNFVFKGMLLKSDLNELEDVGISIKETPSLNSVVSKNETNISLEDFGSPIRLGAIKMAGVYMAFFCFENSVRDLIKERLSERVGLNWWKKCVSEKIKKDVENRKNKDLKNKWHAPRAKEDVYYTDFGHMSKIICDQWEHFEDLFPSQDWIRNLIDDLEQSRHVIAHNNILNDRDINRIKVRLDDWLKQVG